MTGDGPTTDASLTGTLVLVATPIGNLGDLSPRARQVLADADMVCCEDTRRTRQLLTYAGISGRRLTSLHGHNEASRLAEVVAMLENGATVAVVSDAGTPAISDPGARLVAAAAEAGATVTVVPGPSAVLAALVASGLPTERFCFEGFLPRRGALRHQRIEELATEMRTAVVLEAPGRVAPTLAELAIACGAERRVVVARELTKVHEELWRGTLAEAEAHFATKAVRGEVVIVLDGAAPAPEPSDALIMAALEKHLAQGETLSDAARSVAQALQVGHRRAYQLALGLPEGPPG